MSSDHDARAVVERFFVDTRYVKISPLGNHGGFSGARLWGFRAKARPWCLRAWPENGMTPERLDIIHRLMEEGCNAGLQFVPCLLQTRQGDTFVEHAGRLWEAARWMPGQANFHDRPSPARLNNACTALARLHCVWLDTAIEFKPCPAVGRRLDCFRQWQELTASGWHPAFLDARLDPVLSAIFDPVRPWAERAWHLVRRQVERLPGILTPWISRPFPVHPCLCDIWHDHVLFGWDELTGIVDYGSIKMDHVAVDLARLLGSLVGDNESMYGAGIRAYRTIRPIKDEEIALIQVLDITGTVLGAANWLRWLYHEGRKYPDREAVARRLAALVERMEQWK